MLSSIIIAFNSHVAVLIDPIMGLASLLVFPSFSVLSCTDS